MLVSQRRANQPLLVVQNAKDPVNSFWRQATRKINKHVSEINLNIEKKLISESPVFSKKTQKTTASWLKKMQD